MPLRTAKYRRRMRDSFGKFGLSLVIDFLHHVGSKSLDWPLITFWLSQVNSKISSNVFAGKAFRIAEFVALIVSILRRFSQKKLPTCSAVPNPTIYLFRLTKQSGCVQKERRVDGPRENISGSKLRLMDQMKNLDQSWQDVRTEKGGQ